MTIEYKVIYSNRKTLALQMTDEGPVVRAPIGCPESHIRQFVADHERWLVRKLVELRARQIIESEIEPLTIDELNELAERALEVIPERVAYYADLLGVTYGRITIRNQRTRWGSCSAKGNLNFNCLLMLTPPEVVDSVVVHELCHRKEMNHSSAFYAEVLRVFPEYHKWDRWLKENGPQIMRRMERMGEQPCS